MTPTQDQTLLARIEAAFADVKLGDGVGMRQAEAIDEYGDQAALEAARARDEKDDWHRLLEDPEMPQRLGTCGASWPYFDEPAVRFHLPAALTWLILHGGEGWWIELQWMLIFFAQRRGHRLYSALNAEQRAYFRETLLATQPADEDPPAGMQDALEALKD